MKNRFYILIFSPLPPVRSGIADYVNEQMPYFPANWQIGIVVDQDNHTDLSALDHVHVLLLSEYQNLRDEFAGIPKLYHLGNNIHHLFVYEELQRSPGVLYCMMSVNTICWLNIPWHKAIQRAIGHCSAWNWENKVNSWQIRGTAASGATCLTLWCC